MSDLGPIQYEEKTEGVFLGRDYGKQKNFSDKVAHEIDEEIRKIINECYENAKKIINENRDLLELIASSLLEHETLTKEQIDYLAEHGKMPTEEVEEVEVNDEVQEELAKEEVKKENNKKKTTKKDKE